MNKYFLFEFHEQNGELEYTHNHIYSDTFLKNAGINIKNEDDHNVDKNKTKLLSYFFGNISEDDNDGDDHYWINERLVSYEGFEEIKKSELKTLQKGRIYCD